MRVLRRALTFFAVGTAGTSAYAFIYLVLRHAIPDLVALVVAWLTSTLVTNLVHRRVTFSVRGERGSLADATVFLATSLLGLGLTTLWMMSAPGGSTVIRTLVIVAATGVAGILRFAVMYAWVRRGLPERGDREPSTHGLPSP